MRPFCRHSISSVSKLASAAALAGMLVAPLAVAQGVYRIVGPDGKVTYSDQPPPAAANARPVDSANSAGPATPALPTVVRQAASRYPVTIYTGADCTPCDSGRNFLSARGIPFSEKTVNSNDDLAAFKRLSGATTLPMLTIGGQQLKGYSATEWGQYLDAAGYPKRSTLPSTYRREAASPLVETKSVAAPAARTPASQPAAEAPTEVPVTPPVSNPSGIRF